MNETKTKDFDLDVLQREMLQIEEERLKKYNKILEYVKSKVSSEIFQDILFSIKMSENTMDYKIVNEPAGTFQKDDEFEFLDGYWVNQTVNGGFVGDEYAGDIYIKIDENEYFTYFYRM